MIPGPRQLFIVTGASRGLGRAMAEQLLQPGPGLAGRRPSLSAAVNRRYSGFDAVLGDGDEVVFVPPVSGG